MDDFDKVAGCAFLMLSATLFFLAVSLVFVAASLFVGAA